MKTNKDAGKSHFRHSIKVHKWTIINSKTSLKIKHLYTLALCLISLGSFSQVNVADTLAFYQSEYENGSIGFHSLDSALGEFFNGLPEAEQYTRYHKDYLRSMAFWRDRVEYNTSGESLAGAYTRALTDYLETPTCSNGDKAHWSYAFDPSPVLDGETLDTTGLCTFTGDHAAGIVRSIYMHPVVNNLILAGSNSAGIWRTINGGLDWACVTDDLGIPALGIFDIIDVSKPSEPVGSVLLAITGKIHFHDSFGVGVLRSTNGGESWTRHDIPLNGAGLMSPLRKITKPYAENDSVFAMSDNNIFYSTNRGVSWSEMASIPSLVGAKNYYGLTSTSGTENMIYVSSFGASAKIWRTNAGDIDWEDITSDIKFGATSCLDIEIDETFDFESGIVVLDSNRYHDTEDDILYEITNVDVLGDEHLSIPSITTAGFDPVYGVGGLYLIYDTGILEEGATIDVSCNAGIPEGGEIEYYLIINESDWEGGGLSPTIINGIEMDSMVYEGTSDVISRSKSFDVPTDFGGVYYKLVIRFEFDDPYLYAGTAPILFDDLQIEISQGGREFPPTAIGLSESNGDSFYAAYQSLDTIIDKKRVSILNTMDKGDAWSCTGISSGFSGIGSEGDRLASRDNFIAGFGTEVGFYFGGVKFIRYDTELEDLYQVCSQHDDVRDIQIVKNVGGNNHLVVGDDGGVAYSEDNGMTWTSRNGSNLPITQFYDIVLNPLDNVSVLGGTQDNGTFFSEQAGEWSMIGDGDGNSSGFSPDPSRNGQRFYQVNEKTFVQELVGGDWVEVYEATSAGEGYATYLGRPSTYSPTTGNAIYEGAKGTDSITHPNAIIIKHDLNPVGGYDDPYVYDFYGIDSTSREIGVIEVAPNNEQVIYAAEGDNRSALEFSKLFVSVDEGITYSDLSASSTANILDEDGISTGKSLADILSYKHPNTIETNPENFAELWIGISGVNRSGGVVTGGLFRVLHSVDTGNTWQDYSIGLPPFPINDLIYQRGTNDRLFAATDVGVFYRDASMDEWQCFQEGMPATFANDLEINYCQQTLYAGTFGRGIWRSFIDMPDTEPIIIDTNLTWGGTQQFENDIVIESGNTLILNGTLEMAGGKKVIIEQGAHLRVDGGTITNLCDVFWGGIEVWGDKEEQQTSTNQGKVTLSNNALIENARIGVALWDSGDHSTTGGIIYATNSTFKNNKKDVEFMNYQNVDGAGGNLPNKSYFTNVTFTWRDGFLDEFPLGHVTLYKVDGVRFIGCTFNDNRENPTSRYHTDYAKNNSGIYSIDAQYFVMPRCTDYVSGCSGYIEDDPDWSPTVFENLDFGIYASNISTEHNITVDRSQFLNNLYGVQVVNINSPVVTRNKFEVNNDTTNIFTDYTQRGIHAVRSQGLRIEENNFIHPSGDNQVQGIICSDLGESDERLYKNTFSELDYGVLTQGKNRLYDETGSFDGLKGLVFLCDSNYLNKQDHLVLGTLWGDSLSSTFGVKNANGDPASASGNVFSDTIPMVSGEHYKNLSDNLIRYYYYNLGDDSEIPMDIEGDIVDVATDLPNTCPTELTNNVFQSHSSGFLTTTQSNFSIYSASLDSKLTTYESLVNGGNTDSLMTLINGLTRNNRDTLHSILVSYSPYLTEAVVRATIDHSVTKYPHSWAYELVELNIDVAYEHGFIDFLNNKTYPLPAYMVADVEALLDSNATTDMLTKQLEISDLESKKANAANILLESLKNDTLGIHVDSIRYWIDEKNDVLAKTRLIDTYLQEGDYSNAEAALIALNTAIQNYPDHLQDELTDFISFKNKLVDVLSDGTPMDSLSAGDYSFISGIAENGIGLAQYQAQEMLCFFYGECAEYPVLIAGGGALAPITVVEKENKEEFERSFNIYPNPANTWVAIEVPTVDELLQITVVDLTGRLVYQKLLGGIADTDRLSAVEIWNTALIGDGIYLITITNQNLTMNYGTQKVSIHH